MTNIITPKILKGTRDFGPESMAKRQYVMDKIKSTFIRFGYDAIETPVIEYAETLLGKYGEEGSKLVYQFEDNGGRRIALRYDQTVPTARFLATNYQNLPMPFKRYQMARVWRADRPAKGRYREFLQCDIDIIGTRSLVADAEIAKVIFAVLKDLGFSDFEVKINSRRLINSILATVGVSSDRFNDVIRVLDKLEKIGREAVVRELKDIIGESTANQLMDVMTFQGSNAQKIASLNDYDTTEIETFLGFCDQYEIPEKNLIFDISLARGLDYYTGIIFEAVVNGVDIGSVCGGGRYDDLCGMFSREKFSGTGVSFGFDRLVIATEDMGLLKDATLSSQVLVTVFDESTRPMSFKLLNALQAAGIASEIYCDVEKMAKQMKYADKKQIPFVVICGSDEVGKGEVTVKVMETGNQKTIPQNQLVEYLKDFLHRSQHFK